MDCKKIEWGHRSPSSPEAIHPFIIPSTFTSLFSVFFAFTGLYKDAGRYYLNYSMFSCTYEIILEYLMPFPLHINANSLLELEEHCLALLSYKALK